MANTLTNLLPEAYRGLEIVGRSLIGFIPRVAQNFGAERMAKGATLRSPVAPAQTAGAVTPAATPPALSDSVVTNRTITMDQFYATRFHYTGEEQLGLNAAGIYSSLFAQHIAQAMEALIVPIELRIASLYYNASRAYGTAGTTPFASSLANLGAIKMMLDDNKCPEMDRHLVINTKAAYNMGKLVQLTNVNQSGQSATLTSGRLPQLSGFDIGISSQVKLHTVGTSTGQQSTAAVALNTTTVPYDGGDGGTILIGDTIAPASDTSDPDGAASKYVINTAITAANGNIVINAPGLIETVAADNEEFALGATNYRANLAFHRNFLALATRPPMKPEGGDAAADTEVITDPVSGLSFLLSVYKGYYANQFELAILYGTGLGNPEQGVILMG